MNRTAVIILSSGAAGVGGGFLGYGVWRRMQNRPPGPPIVDEGWVYTANPREYLYQGAKLLDLPEAQKRARTGLLPQPYNLPARQGLRDRAATPAASSLEPSADRMRRLPRMTPVGDDPDTSESWRAMRPEMAATPVPPPKPPRAHQRHIYPDASGPASLPRSAAGSDTTRACRYDAVTDDILETATFISIRF